MKRAVTFRIVPELLAAARQCAVSENRSLTNFVETVIKQHIAKVQGSSDLRGFQGKKPALRSAPDARKVGRK